MLHSVGQRPGRLQATNSNYRTVGPCDWFIYIPSPADWARQISGPSARNTSNMQTRALKRVAVEIVLEEREENTE